MHNREYLTILFLLFCTVAVPPQDSQPDWEDPSVVGINKRTPHTDIVPIEITTKAREGDSRNSAYYRSLNGPWRFTWSRNPGKRPADFSRDDFDLSEWKHVTVPVSWQMQGYGTLIYTNILYSVPKPHVADYRLKDQTAPGLNYYYQVPIRSMVELHIDLKQRGLGRDNTWGNMSLDKYRPFRYRI